MSKSEIDRRVLWLSGIAAALIVAGCATQSSPVQPTDTLASAAVASQASAAQAATTALAPNGQDQAASPLAATRYVVKRGDTLSVIAQAKGCTVKELQKWNRLGRRTRIAIGQVLWTAAPDARGAVSSQATRPADAAKPGGSDSADAGDAALAFTDSAGLLPSPVDVATGDARAVSDVLTMSDALAAIPASAASGGSSNVFELAGAGAVPAQASQVQQASQAQQASQMQQMQQMQQASRASQAQQVPQTSQTSQTPAASGSAAERAADRRVVQQTKRHAQSIALAWPVAGTVVETFQPGRNRGIQIVGRAGDPVRAAAAGRVMYAGAGLNGYGTLILVQHNADFLTAYARNRKLLVKTGDVVRQGEQIAEMGSGADNGRAAMLFEVRRDGKPVNPMLYLTGKQQG
ncbi:peptidoglycan DD-metalloendopeptidase family protein [Burkholderia singularis]|uniref:Membrane proteins related to metalloendopeptidases n=1 Tax=Burkholderia singularis TaxID=1503053 RepID=A0A238H4E6_9BURK|nr:peptidoglycan DD-metalloendopeptidase family protein [Burkholderia singularis]SMG00179.1 Membrane proteins related to metalloendopeptidases [Burkholderia singularis]